MFLVYKMNSLFLHYSSIISSTYTGAPRWSSSSVLDHRSLSPVFKSRCGHIWRLFHLWFRFITFGGCSAHLAYNMHKSGHKTSIIVIISTYTWVYVRVLMAQWLQHCAANLQILGLNPAYSCVWTQVNPT